MKKKTLITIISAALILIAAIIVIIFTVSRMSATTMRLIRYDGEITLTTESGKSLEAVEDRRLTNGNILNTKTESQAWVLLDTDRVVTLMEESTASFIQKGKKLTLNLEEGRIFFDIDRSLENDESFEICTSTMIIGVRGTSGYVDSDENGNSVLYLTTGRVNVSGLDDNGDEFGSDKIKPAQKLTVDADNETITVTDVTEYDLPAELVLTITSDDALLEKITDATDWSEETLKLLEDLYKQGYDIDEILEMGLASDEDEEGDDLVADYTFDLNELTGTWYRDGEQFISFYGDGTGLLMYPPYNPVHPEDADTLVPFTMTYELSQDYLNYSDPVNFPEGVSCWYFLIDDTLVLYDSFHDTLLIKDNAFTPPEDWRTNPDVHIARIEL
ncbi:MAG: FecR domain-containing protein [Lachnospiraceae bacterium]|nr:FecR domain-containing protein [Lachnospiraceae bacterium]